jgi:filamentous hemagglutinin family protein
MSRARAHHRPWLAALLASTSLSAVGSLLAAMPGAWANPQGGQVVSGGGTIVQAAPNRVVVNQTTQNLVLDWQSFNIGPNEQVQFQQPNAASIALNRIAGGDASTIAGELTANGQVWIVNPNGVFFTKSAVVNVAGLVATTSHITAANFMAGNYVFGRPGAPDASVVNEGSITVKDAGLAAFVAPAVANSGVIVARLGRVALVSGSKFTVDLYGDNLVKLAVDDKTGAALAQAAVDNTGKIEADGGTVMLAVSAAETLVNNAINVGGTIEARTAEMKNGKIVLNGGGGTVAVSGTLDASGERKGETGGTVAVLGNAVALSATAKINVSGDAGGGTALVGGNFHGAGPQPNAATTTVAAGAVIDADATGSGAGGNIAIWSNTATVFDGSVTARGGTVSGNGGFIETSSGGRLSVGTGSSVTTAAANGSAGTWLIDPVTLSIAASGGDMTGLQVATSLTTTNVTLEADDLLTIDDTIDAHLASHDLTLESGRTINLTGNAVIDLGGAFSATANDSTDAGLVAGNRTAGAGDFAMLSGATIDTSFGSGAITISIGASTGAFVPGAATLQGLTSGAGVTVSGATLTTLAGNVTTAAGQTYSGAVTLGANVTLSDSGGSPVDFKSTVDGAQALTVTTAGTATFAGAVGGSTALTSLAVTTGTAALNGGTITTTGGQTYSGPVTLGAAASLSDTGGSAIDFASTVDGAQALTVTTTGVTTFGGAVGGTTPLTSLAVTTGTVDLGANVTTTGGEAYSAAVTLGGNATLTNTGGNAIDFASTVDGAETLTVVDDAAPVFGGAVGGTTPLAGVTMAPRTASRTIGVGDMSSELTQQTTYDFSAGDSALEGGGAGLVQIGLPATTGEITLHDFSPGTLNLALVNGGSGAIAVSGTYSVGTSGSLALSSGSGGITFAGNVTTAGGQAYTGAVTLGAGVTLSDSAGGTIDFKNTVDGAQALTAATGGATIFEAAVGGGTPLASLAVTNGAAALDANVTTSGGQTYSGAVTLGASATLSDTGGSAISFASTIDGTTSGAQSLSIATSGGTISLGGSAGGSVPLGTIGFSDGTLDIGVGVSITTAGGAVSQTGATILVATSPATAQIDTTDAGAVTGGASIGFTGAIDGGQALVLAAGTSAITLGTVGGTTALTSLSATGSVVTLGGSVKTTAAQSYTDTTLDLNGATYATTVGGTFTETGATVLGDAVTVDTSAGNQAILFQTAGTIDGGFALTLKAGTGNITLGAAGGTTALTSLSATGATVTLGSVKTSAAQSYTDTTLDLNGSTYATTSGTFTETGATVLGAAATVDTSAGNQAILFQTAGTIDGGDALTLKAGTGTITLGAVGGTTALASLTATATTVTLGGSVKTTGAQSYTDTTLDLNGSTYATTSGTFTETGATVLGDAVTVDTSAGNQAILFQTAGTIDGAFALTMKAGTGTITLGTVGGTTALASLAATATNSTITLGGTVRTTGAQSYTDATLNLNASSYTTTNGTFTETGATVLGTTVTVDTAAGNKAILFHTAGTIDGGQALTLSAGTGAITLGAVGGTTALTSLTATATTITLGGSVKTTGSQSYTDTTLDLNGASYTTTASGTFTETGATVLGAAATVDTSAGNQAILFQTAGTIDGGQALTLKAGTGTITLGAVGGTTALASLSAMATTITLGGSVRTTGAQSYADTTLDLNGTSYTTTTSGSFTETGATVLGAAATVDTSAGNQAILFQTAGTIDGGFALTLNAGTGAVTLGVVGGTTALSSLAATGSTVTLGGSVKTAGAQSYTDTALDLNGASYTTTVSGSFTETGATVLADTVTIDTSAGNLAILFQTAGTIDGGFALTLKAGTGAITLGAAGGTTALTSLTATGATIALGAVKTSGAQSYTDTTLDLNGASYVTTNGAFIETGATVLSGGATVDTSAGNQAILFQTAGTIDGAQALTLKAGTGTITLGVVGGTTALASLSATGKTIVLGGVVKTTGAQSYTDTTLDLDGASYAASAGSFAESGATVLGGDVTVDTSAGNQAILFQSAGTIDGGQTLVLKAGTGAITLGAVGGTTVLTALTATGGVVTLGGSVKTTGAQSYTDTTLDLDATSYITTVSGSFTETGATVLGANVTVDTSAGNQAILFHTAGAIDGGDALVLNAGTGNITLGAAGGTTALTSLSATGTTITLAGSVKTAGAQGYSDTTLSLGGTSYATTASGSFTETGATVLTHAVTVDTSAGNQAILFQMAGTIDGGFALTLKAGTGNITLGTVGGTTVLASLSATGATVTLGGSVKTSGAQSYTDTTLDLNGASYTATNGAFTETGATVLGTGVTIDTSAGNKAILFQTAGTIDGADALALSAGTGAITLGTVGGTTALSSLTATGSTITLGGSVKTAGAQSYTDTTLDLNGASYIASAGSFTETGATVLGAAAAVDTSAGNQAILFQTAGTIDGGFVLTLKAGAGTITLGAVGGTTALTSLSATATTITLGGSVKTTGAQSYTDTTLDLDGASYAASAGSFAETGATVLGHAVTVDTSAGNQAILFQTAGTLDGGFALTLTAGTGTVTLGTVGGTTALASLSATGSTVTLGGSANTTGAQSYTATTLALDGGSYLTSGGTFAETGGTVLGQNVSIDTTSGTPAGATISFAGAGTINGGHTLVLTAGTAGNVSIAGAAGGTTPLAGLTASGATITLSGTSTSGAQSFTDTTLALKGGSYLTAGATFAETGAISLLGGNTAAAVTIDTTAGGTAPLGATLSFGTIDGTGAGKQALTVSAGTSGGITLSSDTGKSTTLGPVTLMAGGPIVIGGSLIASGGAIDAVAGGAISVSGPVSTGSGGAITLEAGGALTTTAAGAIGTSQSGAIILSAMSISLGAEVDGGSTLTLTPASSAANIGLGTTGDTFNLTQAQLGEIGADFTGVTIATGTGTVQISNGGTAVSFAAPVTISGAVIAILDDGGITTSGKALTLSAPVMLSLGATLDTTAGGNTAGANVTLGGAVAGTGGGGQSLGIDAGTGGTISLAGSVGSASTPLGAVTLSDATLELGLGVNVTLSGAAFGETGATVLQGGGGASAATITATNGAITFTGAIDGDQANLRSLTLAAGNGTITLEGNVGTAHALNTVSLSDGELNLVGNVTIATGGAPFVQSGPTLLSGVALTASTASIATSGGAITFGGTIDGDALGGDMPGLRALDLAAGSGTISLGGSVGAGVALGAVTLSDAQLNLAAGITTANAAVSETGATILGGASVTVATSGGAISFGTIDGTTAGGQSLSLSVGSGTLSLSASVGAQTALAALTLTDATLDLTSGISLAAGSFSQSGATRLQGGAASATTVTTSSGAIEFGGAIDGDTAGTRSLTLAAGTGSITLEGSLGGTTALGAVGLTGAAIDLAPGAGIATAGGAVAVTGGISLADAGGTTTVIDTAAAGHTAGAGITLGGAVDGGVAGDQALSLVAGTGGTIALSGSLGGHTALGAVTISGATAQLSPGTDIATLNGAVTETGALVLPSGGGASTAAISTGSATITISGTIDGGVAGQQALTLDAGGGTIALSHSIGGATPLGAIGLNDTLLQIGAGVNITTAGGAFTQGGATVLLAGGGATASTIATTGGGAVAGADIAFGGSVDGSTAGQQGLAVAAGTGGTITLDGSLGGVTPLGAVTLSAAALQAPNGLSIATAGGAVSLSGAVALGGPAAVIDTTANDNSAGANIMLAGSIDASAPGAQPVTLNAGTGGTITLSSTIGGTTPVGTVTLNDAVLQLSADIVTAGASVTQTGATIIGGNPADLSEDPIAGLFDDGQGPVTLAILAAGPVIDTTGGGVMPGGANISLAGQIDGAVPATEPGPSQYFPVLTLHAGSSGMVSLGATVGQHTPLAALVLTDAELDLAPNMSIAANLFSQTGATVLQGGTTTIAASDEIVLAGPVDAASAGGEGLTLQSAYILLQGSIGGTTPLAAVTLNGETVLNGSVSIVTNGAVVSATGSLILQPTVLLNTETQVTIDTTAGGTIQGGANIAVNGTVDGHENLTLNAGSSGHITVMQSVGGTTPLSTLTLNDATLALSGGITLATQFGAISQTGTTILTGAATTQTLIETTSGDIRGADISFSGPIDGAAAGRNPLTFDAGFGGTITLLANVGAGIALGAIAFNDAQLDLPGGASFTTAGGAFTQAGNTAIATAGAGTGITVNTTANGHAAGAAIAFGGTIDGFAAGRDALTLNAGTSAITLGGTVGGTTAMAAMSFTDATLALGVNVTLATSGGAVTQPGSVSLLGGATASAAAIDTTAGGTVPAGANITIGGAIDATGVGQQALALNAGTSGAITLGASIGAHTALGGLTLSEASLHLPANFSVIASGGTVALAGATQLAGTGAQTFVIDTTGGGAAPAGGNITIGTLDGGAPGKLAVTLNAGTGGTIALTGAVGGTTALASLSLTDQVLELGPGGVSLDGTPFTASGATVLLGNGGTPTSTTIDTTGHGAAAGATIAFAGPINGSVAGQQSLSLNSGTGDVTLGGSIGATTPLGALTFSDAELWLGPNLGIATAGGAVMQTGLTHLLSTQPPVAGAVTTVTVNTAAGGVTAGAAITFAGNIDAVTSGGASGGQALTLNAGTGGTITLGGNAGGATPLGGLALTAATIDFNGTLYETNAGAIAVKGAAVFQQTEVAVLTVMETVLNANTLTGTATTGASITFSSVTGPKTTLTLDPGISFVSVGGGSLAEIVVLEGSGSVLSNLVVNETSLGGSGIGNNLVVGGQVGADAAERAFIRPGGNWVVDGGAALITDPALQGLSNEVLNNEGIGPAIALMIQIQQLIARGDTGETAAQQAFDQYPNRSNYGVDPFHQKYNILGVAQQQGVAGGFEDISYIQDGFWEGLLKK